MMKAGIYHGVRDIRLEEIDVPAVTPGHVLIDTKVSGICGSDIHQYLGAWDQPRTRVVTGHELSGVVVEVGDGVSTVSMGDHVCSECFAHCGTCRFCRIGLYNLCENIKYISQAGYGGFAEYALLSASSLFQLPHGLSFEEGALVEPLAVAHRSLLRTGADRRACVAILGAGTIGLLCLAIAKVLDFRDVLITAKYEHQARMAETFGADHVIRVATQDVRQEATVLFDPPGVDVVVDTVASEETFHDAVAIVRKAGTICLVGGYTTPLSLSLRAVVSKELHVVGSQCYSSSGLTTDFAAVIDLVASKAVDGTPLITHRFPLEEVAAAFQVATDKRSRSIKVLLCQE
jgi:(R,R)-butanediol dehydrogenase/meso-butanediol dehydrogenase/diacetyl reductase